MIRLLPFLLLLVLFLLPRNRNRHVLRILAIAVVAALAGYACCSISPERANIAVTLSVVFLLSHMYGLCAAWLLSGKDRIKARAVNLFFTMAKAYVFGCIALFAYGGGASYFFIYLVMEGIAVGILFIALLLTGVCCLKTCTATRVVCWLAFWSIATVLLVGILFGAVAAITSGESDIFLMVLGVCTFIGVILYVLALPFIAMALWDSHFKQRFYSVFPFPLEPEHAPAIETTPPPLEATLE